MARPQPGIEKVGNSLNDHSSSPPILVSGIHRSGTTWVGKMLTASGQAAYISEPLNVQHRPGVLRIPTKYWYTYICPENESDFIPAIREMLDFRYHYWLEIKSLRSRKDFLRMGRDSREFLRGKVHALRPLLKDPFVLFSIPWFIKRFDCQVVVMVRHPAAFAGSLKRLNWPFQFSDLLAQNLLMRDWLEPQRSAIECLVEKEKRDLAAGVGPDIIAQGALLWRICYGVVEKLPELFPRIQVWRHEDLSIDPDGGFRNLYQSLGLDFSTQAQKIVLESSSAENPKEISSKNAFATRLDSRANLDNWKRRLSPEEIGQIRELTEELTARYYPDFSWD